jgi:hypothetical protein
VFGIHPDLTQRSAAELRVSKDALYLRARVFILRDAAFGGSSG